jgi:uncharacterized protein RhaS with RHS repeats
MYSPALGRFLQPDPIGASGGINIYAYAGNDPMNFVDPSGLGALAVEQARGPGLLTPLLPATTIAESCQSAPRTNQITASNIAQVIGSFSCAV